MCDLSYCGAVSSVIAQRAKVARQAHILDVVGSIPTAAKYEYRGHGIKVVPWSARPQNRVRVPVAANPFASFVSLCFPPFPGSKVICYRVFCPHSLNIGMEDKTMKDNFDNILKFTLRAEGGFVDDPDDPGGMTNLGISFRFLKGVNPELGDVNNDGVVDEHDIEEMTLDAASKIYRVCFWDACKCDDLPSLVDDVVFDTGVNMGTGTAIKLLQRTLNNNYGFKLDVDGGLGAFTMNALKTVSNNLKFAKDYLDTRRDYYTSLADEKPRFQKFLKGWLNRVNDLESFVGAANETLRKG